MPRVAASNGIRPEIRALAVLKLGVTVTPKQINDHVGTGDYAAKYVSFLNTRYGFNITSNKDGRKVVSYTVVAEPANASDLRSATPKVPKVTKAATAKTKTEKTATVKSAPKTSKVAPKSKSVATPKVKSDEEIKAKNLETMKKVAAKLKSKTTPKASKKKVREFDDVTEAFGTSGEVGTSFSLDHDWDSIEGLDLSKLL